MDPIFNQLKSILSRIQMTDVERARVRGNIAQHLALHPAQLRPRSWISSMRVRGLVAGTLALVVLIGSGTTISYASIRALPTDTLYPVKLFRENLIEQSKTSPKEKASYQISRVETRITEAATLAKQNKLDTNTKTKLALSIKEHVEAVNMTTHELSASSPTDALEATGSLQTSLTTGVAALSAVDDNTQNARVAYDPILETVEASAISVEDTKAEVTTLVTNQPTTDVSLAEAQEKLASLRARVDTIAASIGEFNEPTVPVIPNTPDVSVSPDPTEPDPSKEDSSSSGVLPEIKETTTIDTPTEGAASRATKPQKQSLFRVNIASAQEVETPITEEFIPAPETQAPSLEAIEFVVKLQSLLVEADTQLSQGQAGAALVTLQIIEQMIAEQQRLTQLEAVYQIELPGKVINISILPQSDVVSQASNTQA